METSKQQSLEDILVDSPTLDDNALRERWTEQGHTEALSDRMIAEARSRFARNMTRNAFVHRYVAAYPQCSARDVQDAWRRAGGTGEVVSPLVSRSRRDLGMPPLTSASDSRSAFIREYLSRHPGANASEISSAFESAHPGATLSDALVYAVKRKVRKENSPPATPPARRAPASTSVYESVERLLDQAISLCDRVGDDALASELRRARRLVARSILGANP